ncbi:FecR domain-containing protein [Pedobacter sp. ASV1-7]|uniref:FecR family protein n=1 Tax=Pedobacter sp. ASV1-7 TaxID=3145237 RepID=UPI0032E8F64C
MKRKRAKKLFSDYLKGKLNKQDEGLIQAWYDDFGESEKDVPGLETPQNEQLLQREMYASINAQVNVSNDKKGNDYSWLKIAASIFVIALAGIFAKQYVMKTPGENIGVSFSTYSTTVRQIKKILLQDSTVITLNANSKIRVPSVFAKDKRDFFLEEGEAFFDVKRDASRPFVITASGLKIRVLGTSFNINSYKKNRDIKVKVTTGKVRVSNGTEVLKELIANQQLSFNKNDGNYRLSNVAENELSDWRNGNVVLKDADFEELSQAVLNVYGLKINCINPNKDKYRYNITLRSGKTDEQILKLICAINDNKYRRDENGITIQ